MGNFIYLLLLNIKNKFNINLKKQFKKELIALKNQSVSYIYSIHLIYVDNLSIRKDK